MLKREGRRRGKEKREGRRNVLKKAVRWDSKNLLSPHEFEGYTEVISKVEIVDHMDYVVLVVSVLHEKEENEVFQSPSVPSRATHLLSEGIQDLHFHKRLMVESFLVPDDLYGHGLIDFVIKALRK